MVLFYKRLQFDIVHREDEDKHIAFTINNLASLAETFELTTIQIFLTALSN